MAESRRAEIEALRDHIAGLERQRGGYQALADAARDALRWLEDNTPDQFDLAASGQTVAIREDPRPIKAVLRQALVRTNELRL